MTAEKQADEQIKKIIKSASRLCAQMGWKFTPCPKKIKVMKRVMMEGRQ